MAENIILKPEEVWSYFKEHSEELKSKMHLIASNKDYGIEVYLTEHNGYPEIIVENDNTQLYKEGCLNASDCKEVATDVYRKYTTSEVLTEMLGLSDDEEEPPMTDEEKQELEIEMRECDMSEGVESLLDLFLGGEGVSAYFDEISDVTEDLKDLICEYLYCKWGIEVFRPMVLEFDDGTESYEEYPYSLMELENENNPLFMS